MNALTPAARFEDRPDTQALAAQETILSPRFYTTDFDAMDRIDVGLVREEWDGLIAEMAADPNRTHFRRAEVFEGVIERLPEDLRREFVDFLVSSMTSEFSGCVLYAEIAKRVKNPDVKQLFKLMSRDESRHAGFLNETLKDSGIGVDLGFLTKTKKYTFFKPKFIFYAVYLSEKIGYARYITIFRHLQKNPQNKFHPIFDWFQEWCNDEFRHGEAFALLMKADPKLLTGGNRWWIRFFVLSVYATMFVRDHKRPAFHAALGVDPTDYDMAVFRLTNTIARQVFPLELDVDDPRFLAGMRTLRRESDAMEAEQAAGGLLAPLKRIGRVARIAAALAGIYFMRPRETVAPATTRLQPVW